ncbi:unnamed protein product [Symbiodinium pilosum]|uniref:WW domain-containing protein n=1 Tax=Symbiodinium pilosum TaxID=2952 RepID=A0A812X8V7_SYMPI|nr:unnamed protein product [Symbiodinium pilosum]
MGNGVLRRYRTRPEADHDTWRKPKQKGGAASKEKAWQSASAIILAGIFVAAVEMCRRCARGRQHSRPQQLPLVQDEELGCERVEQDTASKRRLRLVCISDTHGKHRELMLPDGDVLIHAGDFTQYGREEHAQDFNSWIADQQHRVKLVILGNHESNADWAKRAEEVLSSAAVLRQSSFDLKVPGSETPLRFFGTDFFWPCQGENPYFGQIPAGTDVVLAHGPAKGCADGDKGCSALLQAVRRIQPTLVISGHIHFARGAALLKHRPADQRSSTILINAANCGSHLAEVCRLWPFPNPKMLPKLQRLGWRPMTWIDRLHSISRVALQRTAQGGPKGLSGAAGPVWGPSDDDDDEDNDLTGFSNLADAANKVWDDLMARKGGIKGKQEMNSLFGLAELKDAVERSVKRTNVLQEQVDSATSSLEDKQAALEDLRRKVEASAGTSNVRWKLGDMAVRRGKGFCELSMVQMDVQPPCFEAMLPQLCSLIVWTYEKLIPLNPQQQIAARSALKEVDEAKKRVAATEESLVQAQEELRQQHQSLTEQVEVKLKEPRAPPGLPDVSYLQKANAQQPKADASSYPEVKGIKEDLRKPAGAAAPRQASKDQGRAEPGTPTSSANGNTLPRQAPSGPAGFPSFQDLSRMQKEAEDRNKTESTRAASYPAPHATREVFTRPEGSDRGPSGTGSGAAGGQEAPGRAPAGETPFVPAGMPGIPSNSGTSAAGPKVSLQQERAKQEAFLHHQEAQLHREEAQRQQQQEAQRQREEAEKQRQERYEEQQRHPGHADRPREPEQAQQPATDWVRYKTPDGQVYYHNERTNHTAWSLPAGATCREPAQAAAAQQGTTSQGADNQDDPFADLRKQEEDNKKQHEQWQQWYQQYTAWYSQQAGAAGASATGGANADAGKQNKSGSQKQKGAQSGEQAGSYVPPRGPAPPKLDAAFEDHAVYQIKSSVLKEMESMVNQGLEVAKRKKALRCLQLRWHPDKNPDKLEVANSIFQFIEETKPWFLHDPNAG